MIQSKYALLRTGFARVLGVEFEGEHYLGNDDLLLSRVKQLVDDLELRQGNKLYPPRSGLALPIVIRRIIDGDTYEVSLRKSELLHTIRLKDCWAEESGTRVGEDAKKAAGKILDAAQQHRVEVPLDDVDDEKPIMRQIYAIGSRIVARIWADDIDIGEYLIGQGLASREKKKKSRGATRRNSG